MKEVKPVRKITNWIGLSFGKWTVLERDLSSKRPPKYICQCECGEKQSVYLGNLKRAYSTQCMKCANKKRSSNLIGKKHYFLTVIDNPKINGIVRLKVKCDCGNIHIIRSLRDGYKSCGKCDLTKKGNWKNYRTPGYRFGLLTIISRDEKTKLIKCKCDCGSIVEIPSFKLRNDFPSCGCYWVNEHIIKAKKLEKSKIGYLTVLKFLRMDQDKRALYLLKCKCGKKFERNIKHLFGSKSCGCLIKETASKGSNNALAKTNEVEVITMRELFSAGLYTRKELAEMFSLKHSHICLILNRKCWKHV